MSKPEILPMVMSDLLERAVDHCEACERIPGVKFDINNWLVNNPKRKSCSVCMAGAIMLREKLVDDVQPGVQHYTSADCNGNFNQLMAINEMRVGNFKGAHYSVHGRYPINAEVIHLCRVLRDKVSDHMDEKLGRAPLSVYRECVVELRKLGL